MSDDLKDEMIRWLKTQVDALQGEVRELRARLNGEPVLAASLVENTVSAAPQLSERELQVGRLLLQGRTRKEIGVDLKLSPNTIKVYINGIYRKLDIHDIVGLRGKRELFEDEP